MERKTVLELVECLFANAHLFTRATLVTRSKIVCISARCYMNFRSTAMNSGCSDKRSFHHVGCTSSSISVLSVVNRGRTPSRKWLRVDGTGRHYSPCEQENFFFVSLEWSFNFESCLPAMLLPIAFLFAIISQRVWLLVCMCVDVAAR